MKKHYLTIFMTVIITLFMINDGFSQEKQTPTQLKFKKNEFIVSVGIFNTLEAFFLLTYYDPIPLFSYMNESEYYFKIGSFNAEYFRNISKVYSLGVSLSYTFSRKRDVEFYGHWDPVFYNVDSHLFSFLINNKFNYIRNSKYNLYSSIGIGITTVSRASNRFFEGKQMFYYDLHLCFIGISFSKKIPLLLELGIGPQGIFKIGYTF